METYFRGKFHSLLGVLNLRCLDIPEDASLRQEIPMSGIEQRGVAWAGSLESWQCLVTIARADCFYVNLNLAKLFRETSPGIIKIIILLLLIR